MSELEIKRKVARRYLEWTGAEFAEWLSFMATHHQGLYSCLWTAYQYQRAGAFEAWARDNA